MKLLLENWRNFVTAGGNVFVGENVDAIPLEYIQPTLDKYYEELSRLFPEHAEHFQQFEPLGSVGKKAKSGDIDLAVDVKTLFPMGKVTDASLESWNLDPASWRTTYDRMVKRAITATPSQVELRAFLYELAKYIGENSEIIKTDLKKVRPGKMFSLFPQITDTGEQLDAGVQMDWMMGNPKWLKFSYFSPMPTESQPLLKGLHRTQLLLATFLAKNHSFKHVDGVFDQTTGKKVAHTPADAMRLLGKLYGTDVSPEIFNTFQGALAWLMHKTDEQDRNAVFDKYLKILDRTSGNKETLPSGELNKCGYVPEELEDYWVANYKRLSLKGNKLCKTTNDKLRQAIGEEKLEEAATPRIINLKQHDIISLIDLILGKDSILDVSEKLAGQNLSVKVENGKVYIKFKQMPKFVKGYKPYTTLFSGGSDGEYTFEMIRPDKRPDYVDYLTDNTILIDFSGNLTSDEAEKLSTDDYTFMTKDQIRRNQFDITDEQRQELLSLRARAEGRLKRDDKQDIAERIKAIILSPNVQSVLGGGVEGLYVTGGDKEFKIPNPLYQNLQRLQAGIYAVWSGKSGIPLKNRTMEKDGETVIVKHGVKERFIADKSGKKEGEGDNIVNDVRNFLSFAQKDIPVGYRMFVSPEEAMLLLDKIQTEDGRKEVYVFLNKRIKNKKDWYSPRANT
jgi:hypothetical protein